MTMYKYLKTKYDKKVVGELFDKLGLCRKHKMPIRGLRYSGNTTLSALEAYLGDYTVVTSGEGYGPFKSGSDTPLVFSKNEANAVNSVLSNIKYTVTNSEVAFTPKGMRVSYFPTPFFDNTTTYCCNYKGLKQVYLKTGGFSEDFINELDSVVKEFLNGLRPSCIKGDK